MKDKKLKLWLYNAFKLIKKGLLKLLPPIIAIILSIFLSVFFVIWSKGSSISLYFENTTELFRIIYQSSFGSWSRLLGTLVYATPLLFTGLAIALAFRCDLFNIGVEGQFTVGMISASIIGLIPGLSPWFHVVIIILGGIVAGALWAALPGYLKASKGINEVIITIMLNYIALHFANWVSLRSAFAIPGENVMPQIQKSAQLLRFGGQSTRLNISIFMALACAFIIYFILWKTKTGFELRAVGQNKFSAEYSGINVAKNYILAMIISGSIAGLGGASHMAGIQLRGQSMTGLLNYGFEGIAVALLASNNPIGCIITAFLFGSLRASAPMLQIQGIPKEIVYLIQALIIIFVSVDLISIRKKVWFNGKFNIFSNSNS